MDRPTMKPRKHPRAEQWDPTLVTPDAWPTNHATSPPAAPHGMLPMNTKQSAMELLVMAMQLEKVHSAYVAFTASQKPKPRTAHCTYANLLNHSRRSPMQPTTHSMMQAIRHIT